MSLEASFETPLLLLFAAELQRSKGYSVCLRLQRTCQCIKTLLCPQLPISLCTQVVASKNPLLGTCFCTRLMTCQQAPWKHCRDKLLHLLPHDEIRRAINECQHRLYYISWKYLAVQNPGLALEFLCNFIKDASDQASLQHRWRKVALLLLIRGIYPKQLYTLSCTMSFTSYCQIHWNSRQDQIDMYQIASKAEFANGFDQISRPCKFQLQQQIIIGL